MINISGSTHRSFIFPADLEATIDFFSDVDRALHYLPHISIVNKYGDRQYRILFNTTELGIYRINIYCDLTADLLPHQRTLHIRPLNDGVVPVEAKTGIYSITSQGYYLSTSIFHPADEGTRIDYKLDLKSELPVPLGARLMPIGIIENLANSITRSRMQEIIEGFISRSLRAYRLSNQE